MVPNPRAAAETLEKEWRSVGHSRETGVLWEPLRPDGEIGRLNLRPFKNAGGTISDLADAFVASSKSYRSDPEHFLSAWNSLGQRLETRPFGPLIYGEWDRLNDLLKPKDYPPIHHSDNYRTARRPAYRILILDEALRLIATTA
jgi:hypothetical protein